MGSATAFGEVVDLTATIRSILSAYTFGTGLFKELLQNSDDAKATKQVLLLDWRTHPTQSLYDPILADKQGPALLAYNDGKLSDSDWKGIRTIYESSKLAESSKIGKYGQGFRSCYHVTDTPQILSGDYLVILDPQNHVHTSGGVRLDIADAAINFQDQLSVFNCLVPEDQRGQSFDGTIFRLPLRTTGSPIKDQTVDAGQIEDLLHEFIQRQVSEVLLFLTHVSCVEIREIRDDSNNGSRLLSRTTVNRRHLDPPSGDSSMTLAQQMCTVEVETHIPDTKSGSSSWRIIHGSLPESHAVEFLNERCPEADTLHILHEQKLRAEAAIAFPLAHPSPSAPGLLFTYLPLPLQTGLPAHIHALFALTPDRQHLRNAEEIGLAKGFDRISIFWNRFLFEKLIPEIWARALPVLVNDDSRNLYNVLPPQQQEHQTGDALYWKHLPRDVLREVVVRDLPVWLLIQAGSSGLRTLRSVLVASSCNDEETLLSLGKAGVPIIRPPEYVYSLLGENPGKYTLLSPGEAASHLRRNSTQLAALSDSGSDIDRILVYLLSIKDFNLELVVGLPLFPSISGRYVSLQGRINDSNAKVYTLLSDDQIRLFNVDASTSQPSIAISRIPEAVRPVLLGQGPSHLSIGLLGSDTALQYLREALQTRFGLTLAATLIGPAERAAIEWLVQFWDWLSSWDSGAALLNQLSPYCLLPARGDRLVSPTVIFDSHVDLGADTVDALCAFGIYLIHPDTTTPARQFLSKQAHLKSLQNQTDVIQCLSAPARQVKDSMARSLRNYLFDSLRPRQLSGTQRVKLMRLRIYPLLVCPPPTSGRMTADRFLGDIPPENRTIAVKGMRLLPEVLNVTFLDDCQHVLESLNSSSTVMAESDVLAFAVEHFQSQPTTLQRAFLERITEKRDALPSRVLHKLGQINFVRVCGHETRQVPCTVLDPSCEAASLFLQEDRYPSQVDDHERAIVRCLQSLKLFRTDFGADLVQDRISKISELGSQDLARRLLALLVRLNYDLNHVAIDRGVRWLPTKDGLRSCRECHHPDAHPRVLFDQVLSILDLDTLPPSFKQAFGWDSDIPMYVLREQLVQLATSGISQPARQLRPAVREMGRRVHELQDPDFVQLRKSLEDHPWVPISLYQGIFVKTEYAVLSEIASNALPPHFYAVPQDLVEEPGVREFLQRMGCQDRPSFSTLIHELRNSPSLNDTILILRSVAELEVGDDLKKQILVPDARGALRAIDTVFFNDLGDRAHVVNLPENRYLAHDQLDSGLAQRLQLQSLGLSGIEVPGDEDMREELTTRIAGVLKQYAIKQALGEFVSNAADAGASKLAVLVDTKEHTLAENASTLLPAEFQKCHSLVLYDDAQFKPEDWSGILRVGRGGKEGRTNTIGQFGLGSLSNFHFTEVPMIVSGNSVLVLDPSKSRLPEAGRTKILMSLPQMRRRYPDQLTVLNGLFGFDQHSDSYPGTIFRLPLRTESQARGSEISKKAITQNELADLIKNLRNDAAGMLFFTGLRAIEVYHREADGTVPNLDWEIEVKNRSTTQVSEGEEYEVQKLHICKQPRDAENHDEEWQIFQSSMYHSSLPEEFRPLIEDYRLREPIITSLAIAPAAHRSGLSHKFYSSVALPLSTLLPFHINGSFILASDRRSIRFDDGGLGSLESKYNHWLLKSRFPLVYAFALEQLMATTHQFSPRGGGGEKKKKIFFFFFFPPPPGGGPPPGGKKNCKSVVFNNSKHRAKPAGAPTAKAAPASVATSTNPQPNAFVVNARENIANATSAEGAVLGIAEALAATAGLTLEGGVAGGGSSAEASGSSGVVAKETVTAVDEDEDMTDKDAEGEPEPAAVA
ncbi:hypothetical protein EVG20_g1277 [Dentipellis fragilis]|uniref:Sacsin/Nov domain-containing protein n=1 Tax=Dentipellis fragilis TaxID=205917 RepID=A0A4Y9ZD15_9AGAM|nr:hypothetical protein EVG20_g1277 [Dentipellis fragilis]